MTDRIISTAIARCLAYDYVLHDALLRSSIYQTDKKLTIDCPTDAVPTVLEKSQAIGIVAQQLDLSNVQILVDGKLKFTFPVQLADVYQVI
jgi:hypothetical protein